MTPDQIRRDVETVEILKRDGRHCIPAGQFNSAVLRLASLASRLVDLPDDVRDAMERWSSGGDGECSWYEDNEPEDGSTVCMYPKAHEDVCRLLSYFISLTEPRDD